MKRLILRFSLTLTRGSGNIAHEMENFIQALLSQLNLEWNGGRSRINLDGERLAVLNVVRYARRFGHGISDAATSYDFHVGLDLGPSSNWKNRPPTLILKDQSLGLTLRSTQFLTTASTGDITALTGTVRVYADIQDVPVGFVAEPLDYVVTKFDTINDDNFFPPSNAQPHVYAIRSRTDYSTITVRSAGQTIYENLAPLQIEAQSEEHIPNFLTMAEAGTTTAGNLLLQSVPWLNSSGARADKDWCVPFFDKDYKHTTDRFEFQFNSKTSNSIPGVLSYSVPRVSSPQ